MVIFPTFLPSPFCFFFCSLFIAMCVYFLCTSCRHTIWNVHCWPMNVISCVLMQLTLQSSLNCYLWKKNILVDWHKGGLYLKYALHSNGWDANLVVNALHARPWNFISQDYTSLVLLLLSSHWIWVMALILNFGWIIY